MKDTDKLLWIVVIVIVAAIGFIAGSHFAYPFAETKSKDALIIECAKALLQLAGVAALGGWIKYLYDQATERRRQAEKANEMRKALLDELIEARSLIEESRRKFRIETPTQEQYRATINAILDGRLKLSRIWNEAESLKYLFSRHKMITGNIKAMKDYLDDLIGEYEEGFVNDEKGNPQRFIKFLSDERDNEYFTVFLDGAYRPAVKEMRKDLLRANRAHIGFEN